MVNLVSKLKTLKYIVIKWERNHKREMKKELSQIEEDLEIVYTHNVSGVFLAQGKIRIEELEH